MANETKDIIFKRYALEATLIAGTASQRMALAQDSRRLVYMDGATPRYFWDSTRLVAQDGAYGAEIIGIDGITGVTPTGGSSGSAGTVRAMLRGMAGTGNANFIQNGTSQQAASNFNISGAGVIGTTLGVVGASNLAAINASGVLTATSRSELAGLAVADNSSLDLQSFLYLGGSLTKNNSSTRQFYGQWIRPTINAGGSNSNTTFTVLDLDTVNTAVTGVTTTLLRLGYGGSTRLTISSAGHLATAGNYAATASGQFLSFGTGTPADVAAGDTEYLQMYHAGASGVVIRPTRSGSGTFRTLTLATSDTARLTINASGVALFGGEVQLSSDNTVNASVSSVVTNKIKVNVGGTDYYLLANTSNA